MDPQEPVPFKLRLKQLRTQAGLSQEDLAFATRDHGKGVSTQSVRVYESGRSRPGRAAFEALAGALGVKPAEFPEYRLAVMREALDEAVVGLEVALATLALVEGATPEGVLAPLVPGLALSPERTPRSGQGRKQSQSRKGARKQGRA